MELNISHEDGYVLARLVGDVTEESRGPFRQQLHPVVGQDGSVLVVDLSQAGRINSAGISNLVTLVADANTHASRVVFAAPPPFMANVLQVTKLNTYFHITESLSEAIEQVTQ